MTRLIPLSDGMLKTSINAVLGLEPSVIKHYLECDERGDCFIPVYAFLMRVDDNIILFDTGAGHDMQPTLGTLPHNLRAHNVQPEDVTHILLTHMHSDHANGLIDPEGRAVYPHAQLYIMRDEYDFWMKDEASDLANIQRTRLRSRKNLAPYQNRITLISDGDNVLNCKAILSAGHSPGHTCWQIDTEQDNYLIWGDCAHFSELQIRFHDTAVTYDFDKSQARDARHSMLSKAAYEKLIVAGAHIAPSGLCTIQQHNNHFIHQII